MFGSKKKDAAFFDAFSEHAAQSVAAAKMLLEMMRRMKTMDGAGDSALGFGFMRLAMLVFGNRSQGVVDKGFRRAQLVSAALYSIGHGGNDAQKTMGIIVAALVASHQLRAAAEGAPQSVPLWVVLACHAAMGLGTLSGGWRIVRTMGMRITKLWLGALSGISLAQSQRGVMQISTGQKITELLLGLLGPSVLIVSWWWGIRRLVKPATARRLYAQPPLDRLMPALVLVLCCAAASGLWSSRRWMSYGLLMPVALAIATALFLSWKQRPRPSE